MDNMTSKNFFSLPSVVLLNAEGDILKLFKTENGFNILDKHRELIVTFNKDEISKFINGELTITDSKGVEFNYSDFPLSMKPNLEMLNEFIKIN